MAFKKYRIFAVHAALGEKKYKNNKIADRAGGVRLCRERKAFRWWKLRKWKLYTSLNYWVWVASLACFFSWYLHKPVHTEKVVYSCAQRKRRRKFFVFEVCFHKVFSWSFFLFHFTLGRTLNECEGLVVSAFLLLLRSPANILLPILPCLGHYFLGNWQRLRIKRLSSKKVYKPLRRM